MKRSSTRSEPMSAGPEMPGRRGRPWTGEVLRRLEGRLRRAVELVQALETRLEAAQQRVVELQEQIGMAQQRHAAPRHATPRAASGAEWLSDVQRCLAGDCLGGLCPCLCHTSLKLAHPRVDVAPSRGKSHGRARRATSNGA
jgi:hypothetical protein